MEELDQQAPQEIKLVVSEEMRSYIYELTKWAKFLSIVGFVFAAFLIIGSFGIGAFLASNPGMVAQLGPLAKSGSTIVTIVYLLMGLFYFYPSLLLFRISGRGQQGVLYGDQESLNAAMLNLKSLFKFWGIMTIVIIVGYFGLIFLAGASMAMR
ncbi:hypothetical protein [Pedobacter nototheniae]|uniref:hypothetical protein n=1 Tax=Pedobacter nototheniae TaxID=2488994 RepID=UPI00103C472D|nr:MULTISPECIES: hypothetical protein [Pedobacter]